MSAEVEEVVSRLSAQAGVVGVLVVDREGRSVRSTIPQEDTAKYAALVWEMAGKGRSVAGEMEAGNELTFLRLRTTKYDLLLVPDPSTGFVTAVIQNPHEK